MNESFSKPGSDISLGEQEHIDRQCDDFERAWRAGHHPKIEDYLKNLPDAEYSDMLRELIAVELERRHEGGENFGMDEYLSRFSGHAESVKAAFDLISSRVAGTNSTIDTLITERPGSIIGSYKLLQKIGEGGFGIVYMADQTEPVKRRVALKIIKPGMDSREVIARFEAERQALALMDHPNIARVFDAGTTKSGRPYFVMELVKGVPITHYCDEKMLTPRERLVLFVPVILAIQHAHQRGVIHRDIKPSNVLVAEYDDHAVPKIIDFGVAKATQQQLTEKTMFTQLGQVVGTIEYMSPEQAKLNQLDIDTRSDVYSLGVLLYELLTGETPFNRARLHSAAYDELLRIIREEEPPKPSLRLSTSESLMSIAHHRRIEPKKLSRLVRGELDWIVMKALEKDRTRRYATANGFASDIQRYLNNEPVVACPPSVTYRFRKFAHRNHAFLAAVALVGIVLILGTLFSTWQAIEATRAKNGAEIAEAVAIEQRDENQRLLYISDMNVATQAWDDNNIALAFDILNRHRPKPGQDDLRKFEWYWLMHQCTARNSTDVFEFDAVPKTLSYSQKLGKIATALSNGMVISFKYVPSQEQRYASYNGWQDWRNWAAYLTDGRLIYPKTTEYENRIGFEICSISDTSAASMIRKANPFISSAPSASGRFIALFDFQSPPSSDSVIQIWDIQKEELLDIKLETKGSVHCLAWSPDEKILAAGGNHGIMCWNCETWEPIHVPGAGRIVNCVAFSADGQLLALGRENGHLGIYRTKDWSQIAAIAAHQDGVRGIAFSKDGHLVSGSRDNSIRLWRFTSWQTWEEWAILKGHSGIVNAVLCYEDAEKREWIVSASQDYTLRFWEVSKITPNNLIWLNRNILLVAASRKGDLVGTLSTRENETSPSETDNPKYSEDKVSMSWFSGKSRRRVASPLKLLANEQPIRTETPCWICLVSKDGMRVVGIDSNEEFFLPIDNPFMATLAAVCPEQKTVAVGYQDGTISCWDLEKGSSCWNVKRKGEILSLAYDLNGSRLATGAGNWNTTIMIYQVADGKLEMTLSGHKDNILDLIFSPVSQDLLISGSFDNTIRVWNVRTGKLIKELNAHSASVHDLIFSSDGKTLVSAGGDRTIRIWDTMTWMQRAILRGHKSAVNCITWVADEQILVSGSRNLSVKVWKGLKIP